MKAKVIDWRIIAPGDDVSIHLALESGSTYYVLAKFYSIPTPPVGLSLDELDELSSRVAKWLSSENLNI